MHRTRWIIVAAFLSLIAGLLVYVLKRSTAGPLAIQQAPIVNQGAPSQSMGEWPDICTQTKAVMDKIQSSTSPEMHENGWYVHRISCVGIVFNNQPQLPVATSSDLLAYGEEIQLFPSDMHGARPQEWVRTFFGENYGKPKWGIVNGHQTLQLTLPPESGSPEIGPVLYEAVFSSGTAYLFMLYPYSNRSDESLLTMLVANASSQL